MNRRTAPCCDPAPGMMHGVMQQMYDVYPVQMAIRQGTLYPELDKPVSCAPSPTGCAEPTACQAMAFAAWEVRLYLNTHPNDTGALQLFTQLCQQGCCPSYACTFAPCTANGRWSWVDDPWPWEVCANERRA